MRRRAPVRIVKGVRVAARQQHEVTGRELDAFAALDLQPRLPREDEMEGGPGGPGLDEETPGPAQ